MLLVAPASSLLLAPAAASLARSRASGALQMGILDNFQPLNALKGSVERLTDLRVARASHILLKGFDDATVQQLESFKAEINNDPEKFKGFAQQHSVCPSRGKGGDLGFFTRGKVRTLPRLRERLAMAIPPIPPPPCSTIARGQRWRLRNTSPLSVARRQQSPRAGSSSPRRLSCTMPHTPLLIALHACAVAARRADGQGVRPGRLQRGARRCVWARAERLRPSSDLHPLVPQPDELRRWLPMGYGPRSVSMHAGVVGEPGYLHWRSTISDTVA